MGSVLMFQQSVDRAPVLPDNTILVGFDRVYGRVMCYPANDAARLLASIAGQKTLSIGTLRAAQALGLKVEVAPGIQHLLEDFMAGRFA